MASESLPCNVEETKNTPGSNRDGVSRGSSIPRGQNQSCHQCRQSLYNSKKPETKNGKERLKCSGCTKYWCEACLRNRYGIIKDRVDVQRWRCPVCNKNCNCSVCRKKEGKLATGILTPLVRNAGYHCVSEFLVKGMDDIAKHIQLRSPQIHIIKSPLSALKKRPRQGVRSHFKESLQLESHGCIRKRTVTHSAAAIKCRRLNHSRYSITIEGEECDDATFAIPRVFVTVLPQSA